VFYYKDNVGWCKLFYLSMVERGDILRIFSCLFLPNSGDYVEISTLIKKVFSKIDT
jgi:hypothetical protein